MSQDVALQAMFDRLVSRFVLPLVAGGEVLVSFPLAPPTLEYFSFASPSDGEVAPSIVRARAEVLREIVLAPVVRPLSAEEVTLAVALHDVLLAAHDDLVGGFRGRARWEHCLEWGLEALERVPACSSAEVALARHSLLHRVAELTRRDVTVRSRFGKRTYLGQDPPKRALIWPRLRRVLTSESVEHLDGIVPRADAREALSRIVELSPLSCLLEMPYENADVHPVPLDLSGPIATVLSSAELCRPATYRHLAMGFHRVGPLLAQALMSAVAPGKGLYPRSREGRHVACGLQYVVNLQLTHCWTESDPEALLAPLDTPWGEAHEGARRVFFGLFAASLRRRDRIGAPRPDDAEMAEREARYSAGAATLAGDGVEGAARVLDWLLPQA